MHAGHREEAAMHINIAAQDYLNKKPLIEATKIFSMDMGQNENIPSLCGNQCGDFYYMSPLIEFIFCIVDNPRYFMDVFMWGEGTTNRGVDNIVLCLSDYLKNTGVINGLKLKRLINIVDNYSGQNNNKCVLELC